LFGNFLCRAFADLETHEATDDNFIAELLGNLGDGFRSRNFSGTNPPVMPLIIETYPRE